MSNNILFALSDELLTEKISISECNQQNLFGQLITNKVVGIAYDNIDKSSAGKEFYKSLGVLYNHNVALSKLFKKKLTYFANLLAGVDFPHALLKGAFLSTQIYKEGHRTSNDIDILINYSDITQLQNLLIENGFVQGSYDSGKNEIIPATRKEIIVSRMNYGETIPFVKIYFDEPLEIDINFSVDFKPSYDNQIVSEILSQTDEIEFQNTKFKVPNKIDFLIHLCCHLYKEATTFNWVKTRRDLMLYKFSDINVFFHMYCKSSYIDNLIKRVIQLKVEKECFYTFVNSIEIYPNLLYISEINKLINSIKPVDLKFMKQIYYPKEKRMFEYNLGFTEWFYSENRMNELKEVIYDEK